MRVPRSSGWVGEVPKWDGRDPDLICTVCGLRYWTYYKIAKDKKCPSKHYEGGRLEACSGKMRKLRPDE
jgi:hypothetical protein